MLHARAKEQRERARILAARRGPRITDEEGATGVLGGEARTNAVPSCREARASMVVEAVTFMDVKCRVRMAAKNIARRIRRWL